MNRGNNGDHGLEKEKDQMKYGDYRRRQKKYTGNIRHQIYKNGKNEKRLCLKLDELKGKEKNGYGWLCYGKNQKWRPWAPKNNQMRQNK